MIVITSIFLHELDPREPLTLEQLEAASVSNHEDESRELIGLYEGKNRVLPIE
jgi:hypothetical protein